MSSKGEGCVSNEEYLIGQKIAIPRMHKLEPNETLTAIRLLKEWAGPRFYFEKVADRETWDFALVNVAAAIVVDNGVVGRSRIASGGVSAVPRRLTVVEEVIKGKPLVGEVPKLACPPAVRAPPPSAYPPF